MILLFRIWLFILGLSFFMMGHGMVRSTWGREAFTCDQVRWAASQYGVDNLLWYARQNGYSRKDIERAKLCLGIGRARGRH